VQLISHGQSSSLKASFEIELGSLDFNNFNISVRSYNNHETVWDFNPCSYAFVVEKGAYKFSIQDLRDFTNRTIETLVVLNWAIGDQNCSEAKKDLENYACTSKDNRTVCLDSNNGKGYYCSCSKGFEGNRYLPDGCQGYHILFCNIFYMVIVFSFLTFMLLNLDC
jgi:hypothetical protein